MPSLKDLKPDPRNARKRTDRSASLIQESLQRFGAARSIVIDEEGRILAGNGTVEGAKAAGISKVRIIETDGDELVAVRRTGLTEEQKIGLALADNRTSDLSEWDGLMLQQLSEEQDLAPWFEPEDLAELLPEVEELAPEEQCDADAVPEPPVEPVTKPGDVWLLEKHRVMCGDSTVVTEVERLMDGAKADMVFTDPPYGMNLDTDYTKMAETKVQSKKYRPVIGDDQAFDASALIAMFPDAQEQFWWGGDWYYETLPRGGSWIVWDKRNEASDGLTGNHFEMLWSQNKHRRYIIRHLWSGFTARNKDTKRVHPTEKPVEVLSNVLENYGKPDWTVLDLFGGSGSTLIACEKTGRQARLMELDPSYCDVIVKRWQDFTGKTATLEATGEPFTSAD